MATAVGAMRHLGTTLASERPVERRAVQAVELDGARDEPGPLEITRGQPLQPPAQGQHRLGREPLSITVAFFASGVSVVRRLGVRVASMTRR